MNSYLYVIAAAIVSAFAYFFMKTANREKVINAGKIPETVIRWKNEVKRAANEFNVPFDILFSVLWVENAGRMNPEGSAGEKGLMQLKPIAIKDLRMFGYGQFDQWDKKPKQNIRAGAAYLKRQRRQVSNWKEAVKAYNQGVKGRKQNPEKAKRYLKKVQEKRKFFT